MLHTDADPPTTISSGDPEGLLSGWLHTYVAFDWGDEIDLNHARRLGPSVVLDLSRRPRTPSSIAFKPAPIRFTLQPIVFNLPGVAGSPVGTCEATVFDFAVVSVAIRLPFQLPGVALRDLAGSLAESATAQAVMRAARAAVEPLHQNLLPAIKKPAWPDNLWEEYYVFQFPPGDPLVPDELLARHVPWLAGLLRLEDQQLSDQETAEAVRLELRYGRQDLFVPDWGACVLLDNENECTETLQAIEFANLQLLQYRVLDDRLNDILTQAYRIVEQASGRRLPIWRGRDRDLRLLGGLKVDATDLFERTGNVLKLVGDQYLARVYRLLAARFHLPEWEKSIRQRLEAVESVYQVISHEAAAFRTEFLEIVVILLIAVEIALGLYSLVKH
jgi:hypothetical protein